MVLKEDGNVRPMYFIYAWPVYFPTYLKPLEFNEFDFQFWKHAQQL